MTICLGVLSSAWGLVAPRALAKTTGDLIAARQLPLPAGVYADSNIAVGDVNGDKREDFVILQSSTDLTTNISTYSIKTLINNGNGSFTPVVALTDAHGQAPKALADLNGDGLQDLVCTFGYDDPNLYKIFDIDVEVSFGHGDGTFAAPAKYTVNGRVWGLKTGDINGDGKIEVGPFVHSYKALTGPIAVGDINHDGALDILTASPLGVSRFINAAIPAP